MAQEDRFAVDTSRPAHTDRLPALLLGYGVALLLAALAGLLWGWFQG
jgi:hypothetical protein